MSDPSPPRRPAAFTLDPPATPPPASEAEAARAPRALPDLDALRFDPPDALEREEEILAAAPRPGKRGPPFGKLLAAALGALLSIGIGLAVDELIRNLFARADWLGWLALGVAVLALLALLGIVAREVSGLWQLRVVEAERAAARRAFDLDSGADAERVVSNLERILSHRAETAAGRAVLEAHRNDVIDGRDRIVLAEQAMLEPLDRAARALVMVSARRVSVVTAVSPKAIVDIAYVLFENVRLVRRMSELYGARPGTIGLVKLTRNVVGHLAVTGTISIGDGIVGQVVGHGLAARLSARLGEGVVNGLLTARVGLAAMDLCRPMPFLAARRPRIADFAGDLVRLQREASQGAERSATPGRQAEERRG